MKFTKMHGIGNDYVYVNCFEEQVADPSGTAIAISDRHFGIGSDGLILIKPSQKADCFMDMYNSDGTASPMCGNGIRCVGKYAYDHGIVKSPSITVETASGIKKLDMEVKDGKVTRVTVDMGIPQLISQVPEPIRVNECDYRFTAISMGNPHAVLFWDGIDQLDIEKIGPLFECHERFPDRTNTEFIEVADRSHIRMRVWERGSGETLACGTGACASVAACVLAGLTERKAEVELLGGMLEVYWEERSGHLFMTGPAEEVFQGEIDLKEEIKHVSD